MVLADADFLIGLFYDKDPHHDRAHKINDTLVDDMILAWDVIDEVATKLCYFGKKDIAMKFLQEIFKSGFHIVYPDLKITSKAITIFKSQKTNHVSLTDCMNMAIAKEKKIKHILSFDKIYEKNGFKLVK